MVKDTKIIMRIPAQHPSQDAVLRDLPLTAISKKNVDPGIIS